MAVTWAQLADALGDLMPKEHGEWCSIPMPVPGLDLTIESKNPWRERLETLQGEFNEEERKRTGELAPDGPAPTLINSWYSASKRCWVSIAEIEGKRCAFVAHDNGIKTRLLLDSLRVTPVWNLDAELKAQLKLQELLSEHLFRSYLMTGTFIETSKRSGVTYVFRRGRPTIALRATDEGSKLLCSLCLHPIGYYQNTFCGAMVPTDEVIAHLLLMRGDEVLFWRRANQHPLIYPSSGL